MTFFGVPVCGAISPPSAARLEERRQAEQHDRRNGIELRRDAKRPGVPQRLGIGRPIEVTLPGEKEFVREHERGGYGR